MLPRSEALLAALTERKRSKSRDRSRHLLCPTCRTRTRLYPLKDGRKKCSVCGKKFDPEKKTDAARLRQLAELLLCFALDLTARQASQLTGHRYRLVSTIYDDLRAALARQNLVPGKLAILSAVDACDHGVHDSAFCRRCRKRFDCEGRKAGDAPVFGVKILSDGQAFIDPLPDDEATARFAGVMSQDGTGPLYAGYAGFICRGKFHRFADNALQRDGAEQLWAWMSERLKRHHGVWKRNVGFYLKELEWKYNHRALPPAEQAAAIVALLPDDLLVRSGDSDLRLDVVQKRA